MNKKHLYLMAVLLGLMATGLYLWKGAEFSPAHALLWQDLRQLESGSDTAPPTLSKWDGKVVRIPGYIVPLADNLSEFDEFLLVPDAMACIHVPPPPPNQMVYVRLANPIGLDQAFGPIWASGELQISTSGSIYGDAAFTLMQANVRPYEF